jgi:hypothetical protein
VTKEAQHLIGICKSYLAGQIGTQEYVDTFEQAFWDAQEALETEELEVLDKISLENELYEPDSAIRAEEDDLIGETELRRRVQEHMDTMTD